MARAKPFEFDPPGPTRLDGSGVVPVPWVRADLAPAVRVRECGVGDDTSFSAAFVDAAVRNPRAFVIVRRRNQSEQQLASWRHGNAGQWSEELSPKVAACVIYYYSCQQKMFPAYSAQIYPGSRMFATQALFFYEKVSKQIFVECCNLPIDVATVKCSLSMSFDEC